MAPRAFFVAAAAVLAVIILVFRVVVRRSYRQSGRLTGPASAAQYVAILAWVAFGWLNLPPGWPSVSVGVVQAITGWALFVGGWVLTLGALGRLGVGRSHGLRVTGLRQTGMYGLSRNPQATAFLVAMVGYLVLWPTWRNLGVVLLAGVLAHLMIRTEEEHLGDAYGSEYERYCERVPRYLGLRRPPPLDADVGASR